LLKDRWKAENRYETTTQTI